MAPLHYLWEMVTTFVFSVSSSNLFEPGAYQKPLGGKTVIAGDVNNHVSRIPLFTPPGTNIPGFQCNYTKSMPDWEPCQTDQDKSCWLRHKTDNTTLNVTTDYETWGPTGIDRLYTLVVSDGAVNADGVNFTEAKLINGTFPGPLIEACWGDRLIITVINNMTYNGTSMHWHGIRQWNTMHMDGVNGVTQCPIAPGDNFTYIWNATQYGSSWLHSHYSVQYADGVQAPITIHGPTSDNYDYPIDPLIMSDWGHKSAFEAEFRSSILNMTVTLNGTGNVNKYTGNPSANTSIIPDPYPIVFNQSTNPVTNTTRYLLRLINTSYQNGIIFSIDNHTMQIVEVDFVPIVSNSTFNRTSDHVLVAIGQRYHVIVEALPQCIGAGNTSNCNFWLRTIFPEGCRESPAPPGSHYMETGILRYNSNDTSVPASTQWPNIPDDCVEDYTNFLPAFPWSVGSASNNQTNLNGEEFVVNFGNFVPYATAFVSFNVTTTNNSFPFQTTYGNPTFLNLDNLQGAWPKGWVVIPENYNDTDWVYLVLGGSRRGLHPIHLHGHDFAVLKVDTENAYDPKAKLTLNTNNPPRRDVVVLPSGGYAVIAFKSDNPGTWLLHCHIAFHASGGLAFQIMERQSDANLIWPPGNSSALDAAQRTCMNWNNWVYDCQNAWPGQVNGSYPSCDNATLVQNDSGI